MIDQESISALPKETTKPWDRKLSDWEVRLLESRPLLAKLISYLDRPENFSSIFLPINRIVMIDLLQENGYSGESQLFQRLTKEHSDKIEEVIALLKSCEDREQAKRTDENHPIQVEPGELEASLRKHIERGDVHLTYPDQRAEVVRML